MSHCFDINKKNIIVVDSGTKNEAIQEMMSFLKYCFSDNEVQEMTEAMLYREDLMSTGIGLGIGVPHIRTDIVSEPLIVFGLCNNPISDYESIDSVPIRFIVMIITRVGQHKEHTKILSKIVSTFRKGDTLARLSEAQSPDDAYKILNGAS